MKTLLKWVLGVFGPIAVLLVVDSHHSFTMGYSGSLAPYQEWRHDRLWTKYEKAEDDEGRYKFAVLKACAGTPYGTTPMNGITEIHCYDSVRRDQKRRWRPHFSGYIEPPVTKSIWSKNVVFFDGQVYGTRLTLGCEFDSIRTSWGIGFADRLPSGTDSLRIRYGDDAAIRINLGESKYFDSYPVAESSNDEFITYLRDGRGVFKLWIPQKNGNEDEFRFDMSKFPRELRKLKETCR